MPRVLNRHYVLPDNAIYVGRGSKWGNPFKLTDPLLPAGLSPTEKRRLVIEEYERYLKSRPDLMAQLHELKGKDLVCWCAPLPCHADVLLRLANDS